MDPNQSKIANPTKPNVPNPQNANFSKFQNPNIQKPQNPNFQIQPILDPNFSQHPHYPYFENFNYPHPYPYPYPYSYPSTQNPNPPFYQYPNQQFYQYPNNPYPQNPNNPQNQNVGTKTNVSTNEHKLIQGAKKASKSEVYTSSLDPNSDDPEEEEEEEEEDEEDEEEEEDEDEEVRRGTEPEPEPVTQMPVVVGSKHKEKMKDNIPISGEVLRVLEGFGTEQMTKSQAFQEQQARAVEFSARVKQRELDLQVLYKDTSSMSPQQLRVHKLMLDEIGRRLESGN